MNIYNNTKYIKEERLEDKQYYIYVIENSPQGNIKIGRSSNIKKRVASLSGSNGGSNKIKRIAISKPTFLYKIEPICHDYFKDARIEGTEWFDGTKISFEEIVKFIDSLFESKSYEVCNNIRQTANKR